jgi:glucokinase
MAGRRAIGVDLGGTKILAGIIDEAGRVHESGHHETPVESQDALLDGVERAVRSLLSPDIEAVGIGLPGRIDHRDGTVIGAVNVPLRDVPFLAEMERRLDVPVAIENDASAAALAEHRFGAGRGAPDFVMLTLGTGVGGGVVIDGRLYRGWSELGHMVIVEGGEPCQGACTGRGHVESYCTGIAADRLARRVLGEGATARDLIEQRHPALDEIGTHLGTAIGSIVNIFNPQVVAIGAASASGRASSCSTRRPRRSSARH